MSLRAGRPPLRQTPTRCRLIMRHPFLGDQSASPPPKGECRRPPRAVDESNPRTRSSSQANAGLRRPVRLTIGESAREAANSAARLLAA